MSHSKDLSLVSHSKALSQAELGAELGSSPPRKPRGEGNTGPPRSLPPGNRGAWKEGGRGHLPPGVFPPRRAHFGPRCLGDLSPYRHLRGPGSWWRGAQTWSWSARLTVGLVNLSEALSLSASISSPGKQSCGVAA